MALLIKVTCAIVMCMLVVAPHVVEAITCGTVNSQLSPCYSYLTNRAGSPPTSCCNGVKNLDRMASTSADRRAACSCLKSAAASIRNLNKARAAGLPKECGVNIPYAISPNTDCSRVS